MLRGLKADSTCGPRQINVGRGAYAGTMAAVNLHTHEARERLLAYDVAVPDASYRRF